MGENPQPFIEAVRRITPNCLNHESPRSHPAQHRRKLPESSQVKSNLNPGFKTISRGKNQQHHLFSSIDH